MFERAIRLCRTVPRSQGLLAVSVNGPGTPQKFVIHVKRSSG
jgi:hypothetical protein